MNSDEKIVVDYDTRFVEPKFSDCVDCKHYRPFLPKSICGHCDAGEMFELTIRDDAPTDDELMNMFEKMERDSEDE